MSQKYHGITNHNQWIRKGKPCPYCLKDSKPVHESLLSMSDAEIAAYLVTETKKIKTGDFDA